MHRRAPADSRQGSKPGFTVSLPDLVRRLPEPSKACISMDVSQIERSERDMRKQ